MRARCIRYRLNVADNRQQDHDTTPPSLLERRAQAFRQLSTALHFRLEGRKLRRASRASFRPRRHRVCRRQVGNPPAASGSRKRTPFPIFAGFPNSSTQLTIRIDSAAISHVPPAMPPASSLPASSPARRICTRSFSASESSKAPDRRQSPRWRARPNISPRSNVKPGEQKY